MEDLKPVIARNIAQLRRALHITQAELAQRLHYSDKAVSKWERAESVPDVAILKKMAAMFGVTVDYLLEEEHPAAGGDVARQTRRNRLVITLLSVTFVFLIATFLFAGYGIFNTPLRRVWIIYLYAVPAASVVALVFSSVWARRRRQAINCAMISLLIWSALASVFFSFRSERLWLIFTPGIPAQLLVVLWSRLKFRWK